MGVTSNWCHPRGIMLEGLPPPSPMVMEVTPERVQDTLKEVDRWGTKQAVSRKDLQQLLGKLHFVCKNVRRGSVELGDDAKADIKWFQRFLLEYNWVSLIPDREWSEPDVVLATDACLAGCGGVQRGVLPRGFPTTDNSEGSAIYPPLKFWWL